MGAALVYSAPVGVSVGTASTEIVAETPRRRYLVLTNDSDTVIYLGIGATAVLNRGLRVEASGGRVVFGDIAGGDAAQVRLPLTTQAINGISSVASKVMLAQEAT